MHNYFQTKAIQSGSGSKYACSRQRCMHQGRQQMASPLNLSTSFLFLSSCSCHCQNPCPCLQGYHIQLAHPLPWSSHYFLSLTPFSYLEYPAILLPPESFLGRGGEALGRFQIGEASCWSCCHVWSKVFDMNLEQSKCSWLCFCWAAVHPELFGKMHFPFRAHP